MSTTAGEQRRCEHGLPPENCAACAPWKPSETWTIPQQYLDQSGRIKELESKLDTVTQEREDYRRGWNRSDEQVAALTSRLDKALELLQRRREGSGPVTRMSIDEFLASESYVCLHSLKGHAGDPCPVCGEGPCKVVVERQKL